MNQKPTPERLAFRKRQLDELSKLLPDSPKKISDLPEHSLLSPTARRRDCAAHAAKILSLTLTSTNVGETSRPLAFRQRIAVARAETAAASWFFKFL